MPVMVVGPLTVLEQTRRPVPLVAVRAPWMVAPSASSEPAPLMVTVSEP
jgi:hypothetical protein